MTDKILFFDVVLKERLWGGDLLKDLYKVEIEDKIGEAWIVSGHNEGQTTVQNGKYAGVKLNDLYLEHPELFGESRSSKFPLLIKYLDAQDDLSVQVHPEDEYSLKHHNDYGKNECWYILDAKEGANLIYGQKSKNKEEMKNSIENGAWDEIIRKVPVKKGDFFNVPVGTVHAIGSGIQVLEIQQSSDITYRIYDFDRKDKDGNLRELHIDRALDVIKYDKLDDNQVIVSNNVTRLVSTPYFTVDKITINGSQSINQDNEYSILFAEGNDLQITIDDETFKLEKNNACIVTSKVNKFNVKGEGVLFVTRENNHEIKKTYNIK